MRPLVLCYHAASAGWPYRLSLPPEVIERQVVRLLRRGYRPATAAETVGARRRLLHVSFDDAFRSIANVLPALERLGVPVTVFACPGYADDGRALAIPELAAQAAAHPSELQTMTWDELRALAERGVEIGSHTMSHPHLPTLDAAGLRRELVDSRERIEDELGRPCPLLAYPFGEWDNRVVAAASAAGYRAAFALLDGDPGERRALPRSDLYPKDERGARFMLKTEPLLARPLAGLLERARAAGTALATRYPRQR